MTSYDRALGALTGLALGDALGMSTQSMSRAQIEADHGTITGLVAAGPHQRIAAGMPAGRITDDTEQALLLAQLLVDGGGTVGADVLAAELLAWERNMAARGSLDLLGPSTKRAVERISAGEPPEQAGRDGVTNGAAMRIAPVGIAVPAEPLDALVDTVVAASFVTHATSLGLSAATAVAAAVSVGVAGGTLADVLELAPRAADLGAERGRWVAGGHVGARIAWATRHLPALPQERWADELDTVVGTSVAAQESVVAAFAIAAAEPDPWAALCLAASVGGDTDTIAAILGAVLGSVHGVGAWPADAVAVVTEVNGLDLASVAGDLLALREARP
ncbi:ADP-ribosylglycohydrolase family protein [Aeromicrobium massiliense]|uniref:ADP-ribosylglycohydrolase family protein n=1 Tax=Aeromicrobium massiliense TaxID=1464554 RepID=UPI00030B6A0F|nr:ADP-ribosylglycohydrolase family protein [Aeromicrobium massiliense]